MFPKGIIFDLDGVICSTDAYHYQAWKMLAERLSIPFNQQTNDLMRGVSRMESLEILLQQYTGPSLNDRQKGILADQKNLFYLESLKKLSNKSLFPKVFDTLQQLRAKGILLAIGSSSKNAPFILHQIGLSDYFEAVSDGNCITHSKPDPEVFLHAAELLGCNPSECIVVEDALSGVCAGHAGGFIVACLGNASLQGAGDYNLKEFHDLLSLIDAL